MLLRSRCVLRPVYRCLKMLRPGPSPGRAYSTPQTYSWIWGGESEMETTRDGKGTEGKGNKGKGNGEWDGI